MKKLLIIVVLISLILTLVSGCSASPAPREAAATYAASSNSYANSYASEEIASPAYDQKTKEVGLTDLPLLDPNNREGIMLSYSVDLELQTSEFMKGIRMLNGFVADADGYLEKCYVNGRDFYDNVTRRHAKYTYQIPSAELSKFLMAVEDNYNLVLLKQDSNNVTAEYKEEDTRLAQLKDQEKRLLETLAVTEVAETKVQIEEELRSIQRQISQLVASTGALKQSVVYSRVNVFLSEVTEPTPRPEPLTWGQQLSQTTTASINGVKSFFKGFILVIITILPTLLLLGVIAVAVMFIYRALKKRQKSQTNNEQQE